MKNSKVYSMLSIARKAGKVRSGEFSTEKSVKTGRSFLVVIAGDASDNTKRNLPICVLTTKYPVYSTEIKKIWEDASDARSVPVYP